MSAVCGGEEESLADAHDGSVDRALSWSVIGRIPRAISENEDESEFLPRPSSETASNLPRQRWKARRVRSFLLSGTTLFATC